MPPTPPVRVLIVDDSAVMRKMLSKALASHSEVEVVGSASNGILALDKVRQLEPEAIVLDIEMPEMDGISMLRKLRETHQRLPVVMFSGSTQRLADVTFDALAAGASDYVIKPSARDGETLEGVVASMLVPKLLALARVTSPASSARLSQASPSLVSPALSTLLARVSMRPGSFAATVPAPAPALMRRGSIPDSPAPVRLSSASPSSSPSPQTGAIAASLQALRNLPAKVIAIAASTGGPNALADLISRLPKQLPVPVVVVQHMPPVFTRCLAERLDTLAEVEVMESRGGELLRAGAIYIAPGNRHLEVQRGADGVRTLLSDAPPENSCRPAADVLFRSLVAAYGGAVLGVVLTGMGHDGLRGAREIRDAGGRMLVQSGPSCVVWGMPRAVEEAGLAEAVVPLSEMASAILQRVGSGLLSPRRPEEQA